MLKRHSRFMLVVMAIVFGGCTTIQRAGQFIDPVKTSTTETQTVAESRDASAEESGSSEALPAVGQQAERETNENETTEQGTTAKDIGKAVLTALALLLVVTTVAANIAFIAAVSH